MRQDIRRLRDYLEQLRPHTPGERDLQVVTEEELENAERCGALYIEGGQTGLVSFLFRWGDPARFDPYLAPLEMLEAIELFLESGEQWFVVDEEPATGRPYLLRRRALENLVEIGTAIYRGQRALPLSDRRRRIPALPPFAFDPRLKQ